MTKPDDRAYADFGKQLRTYRLLAGISTQRELADRLTDAGVPYEYTVISHWENGRRCPSLETLITMVQVLVEAGGIQNLEGANHLLWLAGKRSLSDGEAVRIFGDNAVVVEAESSFSIPVAAKQFSVSHWVRVGLVVVAVLGVCLILVAWLLLPTLARQANQSGLAALVSGKDRGEAARHFRWAVRLSPGNAIYHYNLANACEDLADVECAISEYQAAIERRSDLAIAYNNLGRLLIRQERWEEADGLLLAALANPVPPWLEVALRKNLGWALAEQKIYGQAIEQLTWARDMQEAIQPPDAEAYARLAEIYRLMALSYGALEQTVEAQRAWRNCLGLATLIDTVEGQKWEMEAREHLRTLDEGR